MSNPARAPTTSISAESLDIPFRDAYVQDLGSVKLRLSGLRSPEDIAGALKVLDMGLAPAVVVPGESESNIVAKGTRLALAGRGPLQLRVRSGQVLEFRRAVHKAVNRTSWKDRVDEATSTKVFASAGAEGAIGRLLADYPRVGQVPSRPPSEREARQALANHGIDLFDLPSHRTQLLSVVSDDPEKGIRVNLKATNGFPVGGLGNDAEKMAECVRLAEWLDREMRAAPSVTGWYRRMIRDRPHLFLIQGKTKSDNYSVSKVVEGKLRFYNAYPRQCAMLMQRCTQVLERNSYSILDDPAGVSCTFQGASLVRGGANKLVMELWDRLEKRGQAYVHCGDDSWVMVSRRGKLAMFALDGTSFDLTQHDTVTAPIHAALRRELELVDPVSAEFWHAMSRERLTVVAGTVVRLLRHGGPSGAPLQSKVNGMLMDVLINRVLQRVGDELPSEGQLASWVAEEGKAMGFKLKLEGLRVFDTDSPFVALALEPFLFVGYYFHVRDNAVCVMCDVPRTLAQLPYPSEKWEKAPGAFEVKEAMRLGAIVMNFGVPVAELDDTFSEARLQAIRKIDTALARWGDSSDEKLVWAVQQSPLSVAVEPSLTGLRSVLLAGGDALWRDPEDAPVPAATGAPSLIGGAGGSQWTEASDGRVPRRALRSQPILRGTQKQQAPLGKKAAYRARRQRTYQVLDYDSEEAEESYFLDWAE